MSGISAGSGRRRWWWAALQLVLGVSLACALGWLVKGTVALVAERSVPSGWKVIRPPYEVSTLAVQGDVVWAGGRDGLAAFDGRDCRAHPLPPGAPRFSYVRDLLADRQGRLWIAHSAGVTCYSSGEWKNFLPTDGVLPGPATALCEDRNGGIWAGTENGYI